MELSAVLRAAFVVVMLLALSWDYRTRRIPNALTLPAVLVAFGLRAAAGGDPLLDGLMGFALAFGVGVFVFVLGGIGGGDVKLLAAVGAFLGRSGAVESLLASAIVGGALGLTVAARRRQLRPVLASTGGTALYLATLGTLGRKATWDGPAAVTVPYGVAIAVGSLLSAAAHWWW